MTATAVEPVAVSLGVDDCWGEACRAIASPLLDQLRAGRYDECSVIPLAAYVLDDHRTARRRAARARRLGYSARLYRPERHVDDVFAINTSLAVRQGRPMSAGYRQRPSSTPDPTYDCPRHRVTRYGVFDPAGVLVAYCHAVRAGDLALVSQILGHGEHLRNDVMFLLVASVLSGEMPTGGFLIYNRHDSGQPGLREFKERLGFRPMAVEWAR